MKKYKYKISVISPIYKVADYLEEAIESVISQTIDFESNIQLILVNDGSPDKSEEICLKYQALYPDNIIYIKQKNAGVSAAKNAGIKYGEGQYVNFFDPDDKWHPNALEELYKFLEKHTEIDLAAGRTKFFEAKKGYHMLDYKFTGNYVVDIHQKPENFQLALNAVLIRAAALTDKRFDSNLKMAEDAKLAYQLIFEKERYGLVKSAVYYYRVRENQTSAMQTSGPSRHYYFNTLQHCHLELIALSKKKFKKVIPYLQQFLLYDLRFRIAYPDKCNLTESEKNDYVKLIKEMLDNIDDEIITSQTRTDVEKIIKQLEIKYNDFILNNSEIKERTIFYNGIKILNTDSLSINLNIIEVKEGKLLVDGSFNLFCGKDLKLFYRLNTQDVKIKTIPEQNEATKYIVPSLNKVQRFKLEVNLSEINSLSFYLEINKKKIKLRVVPGKFSGLPKMRFSSYRLVRGKLIYLNKNTLYVKKNTFFNALYWEAKYLLELALRKQLKIVCIRLIYWLTKPTYGHQNIWLVSDRYRVAGDNGEALIKYIKEHNEHKIKPYFLLAKNASDFKRMNKICQVISYDSFKAKLLALHANFIISSHADYYVTNPFGKKQDYYQNITKFKYVFLQHGVTQNDVSSWLNRYNKNMALFITSSKLEYDSILNGQYYYNENQVKLTGMPRLDYLDNKDEIKQILIMPTWRSSITGSLKENGTRRYNPEFVNSEFYNNYNKLITHPMLLKVLEEYGYKIKFCLHPAMEQQAKDFTSSEAVQVVKRCNYNEEFCKSKLLITDVSSVAFDFAYLKKSILYFQFDVDSLFNEHIFARGYFSYEKNGFGPVCYNLENLIQTLIQYIKNDCEITKKYDERIKEFYCYSDANNCKRVYEEILKINNRQ